MIRFLPFFFILLLETNASQPRLDINVKEIANTLSKNQHVKNAVFAASQSGLTLGEAYDLLKGVVDTKSLLSHVSIVNGDEEKLIKNVDKFVNNVKSQGTDQILKATWNQVKNLNLKHVLAEETFPRNPQKLALQSIKPILQTLAVAASAKFEDPCKTHLQLYLLHFASLNLTEPWARQMIDSNGRLEPGRIEKRNIYSMGLYNLCLEATHPSGSFTGQYCTVRQKNLNETMFDWTPSIGICVPSTCKEKDVRGFIEGFLKKSTIPERGCLNLQDPLPIQSTLASTLLIVITSFTLFCTGIDYLARPSNISTRESPLSKGVRVFSIIENWSQLFRTTQKIENHVKVLTGLKCLSVLWMVAAMELPAFAISPVKNFYYFPKFINAMQSVWLLQSVQVDTYFFVTACALAYVVNRETLYKNSAYIFQYLVAFWMKNFLIVLIVLMMISPLYPTLVRGPWSFKVNDLSFYNCKNSFWRKLFLIDNFSGENFKCWTDLWYLSTHFQLLVLTPVLIYPLIAKPKFTKVWVSLWVTLSVAITFVVSYTNKLPPASLPYNRSEYYEKIHIRPSTYIASWVVGLAVGVRLANENFTQKKAVQSQAERKLGWAISLLFMVISVFWIYWLGTDNLQAFPIATYISLHRLLWIAALSWIVYDTINNPGTLTSFLGCGTFQVYEKLTNSVLIFYFQFVLAKIGVAPLQSFLSMVNVIDFAIFNILATALISVIFNILFEAPINKVTGFFVTSNQPIPKKTKVEK